MAKIQNILIPLGVCTVVFAMDFVDRFNDVSSLKESNDLSIDILPEEKTLNRPNVKGLLTKLNDYDKPPKPVVKLPKKVVKKTVKLMTKEEQAKQSGARVDLFSGEDKYELIGTFFNSRERYALIKKTHLISGKVNQIKLNEGQRLAEYKLTHVKNDLVNFSEGERLVTLKMFLIKS